MACSPVTLKVVVGALLAGIGLAAVHVHAEEPSTAAHHPNVVGGQDSAAAEVQDSSLALQAARLAIQGDAQRSPLLLLAAAQLLREVERSGGRVTAVPMAITGPDSGDATPASSRSLPPLTVDGLLGRALELSAGQPESEAAVHSMARELLGGDRGITYENGKGRPRVQVKDTTFVVVNAEEKLQKLYPEQKYTARQVRFEGDMRAVVAVVGDGDGDLDLFVYDENTDGLIGKDTSPSSVGEVSWVPRYTGPFRIEVTNVGRQWERFYVLANW